MNAILKPGFEEGAKEAGTERDLGYRSDDLIAPYPPRTDDYLPGDPLSWFGFPRFIYRYARNAISVFSRQHYQVRHWTISFAGRVYHTVHDPQIIRDVLVKQSDVMRFDPIRVRVLGHLSGNSLLTAEGEDWKRVRHAVAPIFSPRHVGGLAQNMSNRCADAVQRLAKTGGEISASTAMGELAFDILESTLFSGDLVGDPDEMRRDLELVLATLGKISPLDALGVPNRVPRLGNLRAESARRRFRQLVRSNLVHRRANATPKAPPQATSDLLNLMLNAEGADGQRLSDQEIEDNLMAFVAAGYETTARGLTWCLYLLSQSPDWMARVREELDAANLESTDPSTWLDVLPVSRAVFDEAMRLYPPVPLIARQAKAQTHIGDAEVKEGAGFITWPFVLHRHETLWDAPDAFRPERFMPGNRETIDRFAYLPFGAGPRICVGMRFALQEAVIALAHLVRDLDWEYVGEEPPMPVMRVTLRPHNGMPMKVRRRVSPCKGSD
ncbi:MAG: cytochrome P450 [Pseudomonadota bacterium]